MARGEGRGRFWRSVGIIAAAGLVNAFIRSRRNKPAEEKPGRSPHIGAPSDKPLAVHRARAAEPGRGRDATAPWHIPWKGWKDIFWRVVSEIGEDRVLALAAGVVFYGLLATFPAVTAMVSLYGLVADPSVIAGHLSFLDNVLPDSALSIIQEQVERIISNGGTGLSLGLIFGLAIAFWSANAGMKAIIDALNVVFEEREKRGFIKLNLVSMALTVGAIFAVLLALGAIVVLPLVLEPFGLDGWGANILAYGRWPALAFALLLGLSVLYRFGPSRERQRWQWVSVGSLLAAVLWLLGSGALSFYLSHFANYNATYGSLGAGIGMMTWLWLTSIVILLGAELNSEIEHQTAMDSTDGPEKPLGTRGATMADTVGAAQD